MANMPDLPAFLHARVLEDAKFPWPPRARERIERSARARLAVLEVHNSFVNLYGHGGHGEAGTNTPEMRHCVGCNYTPDGYYATPDVDQCPVLQLGAEVYDTHPDYRESWRPKGGLSDV